MKSNEPNLGRRTAVKLAASCGLALFATAASAHAQLAHYGVRTIDGEDWSYIDTADGQPLIAAPLMTPVDGFINLGLSLPPDGGVAPALALEGPFSANSVNEFKLTGASPNMPASLIVGFSAVWLEAYGGTLVPAPDIVLNMTTDANGEASYTVPLGNQWVLDTDVYLQFVINDPAGPFGFSASNAIRANGSLVGQTFEDTSRIELLGYTPDELEQLPDGDAAGFSGGFNDGDIDILQGPAAAEASFLWDTGFHEFQGPEFELDCLSRLSQHLMFATEKSMELDREGWTTNGCTNSPDFNFEECCNNHDLCYCQGGTESDRQRCDEILGRCITKHGHPWLGRLYYNAVRKFGKDHFNFHP